MLEKHERAPRSLRITIVTVFVTMLMALAFSSAALAQSTEGYSDNEPDVESRFGGPNQPSIEEDAGLLPFTGADLMLFVGTGVAAIGTGVVVLRRTRPRED